ncbi:MAG: YicC family protein [Bdellovibrionaceae bacterium]|nr:YicC family protein [Pseudobdellovibrionaceae bacterium]
MRSMTGFGHNTFQSKNLELDVNLRSVNGRFFEMRLHLPKEYLFLENKIKKLVSNRISRGTLDLYIHRRAFYPGHQELKIESQMAKNWMKSLRKLGLATGLKMEMSLLELAQLPGVSTTLESFKVPNLEQSVILKTINKAVDVCVLERKREGKALKKELGQLLAGLAKLRTKMQSLRVQANNELTIRYKEKLKKWSHYDENRLFQEIANLIDKADINEEISRLNEHISGCKKLLENSQPVGKKLDFYSQEILREINTIGSKSQFAKLTELVVEAKSLVERFREQVQNVE